MRLANSGTSHPKTTHVWTIADQSLLGNSAYAPAHIACQGARVAGGIVRATARGALPATLNGAAPTVTAYCDADDFVTLRVANNNANATAPLAADLTFDLMWFPLSPRLPTSGTTLPRTTATWLWQHQALGPDRAWAPAPVACPGARVAGGIVVVTPRSVLPRTVGGCDPTLEAYCNADDFLTVRISNNNANQTGNLQDPITLDLMWFPLSP